MSQVRKNDHNLMKVLLGPVISEKATMVAEKNEQVVFQAVSYTHLTLPTNREV